MKSVLVFPPSADPGLPYAALPYLAASLKRHGFRDVIQWDLNLGAFLNVLTREELGRAAEEAKGKLARGRIPKDVAEAVRGVVAKADATIAGIEEAISILRDPVRFYQPESLLFAKRVFNDACRLLSAPYERFSFGKYSYSRHELHVVEEIAKAVEDEPGNPVARFLREKAVPELLSLKPDFVGITVAYFQQLVPSLIIARAVKEANADVFVCLGGPIVSWGKEALIRGGKRMCIDGFFAGEADSGLPRLLEELSGRRRFEKVPNFVSLEDGRGGNHAEPFSEDLDSLPTPDYEGLPLQEYLAPKRVISLSLTKGCYWNRCAFCNYSFIKLGPYRLRDPKLSVEDVRKIVEATGEDVFCFETDVIRPDDLAAFSKELLSQGVRIKWHGVIRFEDSIDEAFCELLAEAGCVRLYAGLESACQRVLDLMDKGTSVHAIERILKWCEKAGIAVEAGVFFGFPTETREEAAETVEFFRRYRGQITRSDAGTFRLLRGSPISAQPRKYGIVVTDVYEERWFELSYDRLEDSGRDHSGEAVRTLEGLYPAIKLIDIPEEIILLAKLGKKGLARFERAWLRGKSG